MPMIEATKHSGQKKCIACMAGGQVAHRRSSDGPFGIAGISNVEELLRASVFPQEHGECRGFGPTSV